MKKKPGNGKVKSVEDEPVRPNNKKKLLGLFLIIFSVFLLLSLVSYSRYDQAVLNYKFSDLFRVFSPDADFRGTNNLVGIFGAYLADFFINNTLGIFSAIFPVIIFVWGFSLLKKISFKLMISSFNFLIIAGLILSAFFGVLRARFDLFSNTYEISGAIGDYLGEGTGRLLGGIGGIIFLLAAFMVLVILAFNIDLEKVTAYLKNLILNRKKQTAGIKINRPEDEEKNLQKIKELRTDKKKKKKKDEEEQTEDEALISDEEEEQTRIRIIRSDAGQELHREDKKEKPLKNDEDIIQKSEIKKVDLEKTGELPERDGEYESDEKLPDPWDEKINFRKAGLDLLDPSAAEDFKVAEEELTRNAELLKEKLKLFDIEIQDISVTPGPVVTLYEIVPAPGVKISKIVSLENDIALALAARGIRIIAPIPGKSAIGVEIPNAEASLVNARSVLTKVTDSKLELPMAFGKTISGEVFITDLSKMPHLLIAGSTGSGKSVGINMIISSLLYTKEPAEVKLIMIDPKKIELSFYNKLRRHYLAVSPDLDEEIITSPQNAVLLLKSVEIEMEKRYDRLAKAGVRNIVDYNKKVSDPKKRPHDTDEIKHHYLPYLIVIIDELADLMITAGKEVEEPIARLAQLARAVGIHLVLATQRPSVNVITGVIKANFSARIAYQVATKIDSRTILDMNGAEQLLGKGDMLFLPTGQPKPIRIQNAFISTDEVERVTNYIYSQPGYSKPYFLPSIYDKKKDSSGFLGDLDPMFEDAARVIVRHQQGSVSLLQRRLKLGYSRAARIVDQLEEAGIVGPNDGSKARSVLVENEEQLETILRSL
ncbi:MAG TPA: DNA translocase FtsK [Ignavibacteriaceae bacterium]